MRKRKARLASDQRNIPDALQPSKRIPVKIRSVRPIRADTFLFVQVTTDDGVSGIGECATWGHLDASEAAMRKFGEYLVGQDADKIERHWQVMHRANHFTGAAISGAISAIDIALWDIKGKALGVPIYQLLGGKIRDQIRLYAWVMGDSPGEIVEQSQIRADQGFTAIGHLNPFLDTGDTKFFSTHARLMADGVKLVEDVRSAVGLDVDICLELHRRLSPAEAITFGRAIEHCKPLFYEDPLKPTSYQACRVVADRMPLPIATGERLVNVQQFQSLITSRSAEFLRVSPGLCGGITAAIKLNAMAEASDVKIVPHSPIGPVALAACLQLDAFMSSFAIQEYPIRNERRDGLGEILGANMIEGLPTLERGFLRVPDQPGLGIKLVEDVEARFPPRQGRHHPIQMRAHYDGSFVDH